MVVTWLAVTGVCAWLLFFGGAERIVNGWLTYFLHMPGMDEREVKFAAVIGWIASTIGLLIFLLS